MRWAGKKWVDRKQGFFPFWRGAKYTVGKTIFNGRADRIGYLYREYRSVVLVQSFKEREKANVLR
jgi:hypothetical protein